MAAPLLSDIACGVPAVSPGVELFSVARLAWTLDTVGVDPGATEIRTRLFLSLIVTPDAPVLTVQPARSGAETRRRWSLSATTCWVSGGAPFTAERAAA